MAVEVKIPPMGESITGGLLAAWLVKSGDAVRKGQPLFSYETDKVTSEGTAEVDGQITIVVNAGTDVVVGQVVASIEAGAAGNAPSAAPAPAAKPAATSAPAAAAAPTPKVAPVAAKSGAAAEISPAVRRLSEETGLDPAGVEGTGKAGRVTKGDMLAALSGQAPIRAVAPAAAPAAASAPAAAVVIPSRDGRTSRKRMSPLRRKIAERLVQAKSETAMLTTFNEVNMAPVMELRKRHGEEFLKKYGVKLGFMSFFVKAAVQAMKEVPAINAQLDGEDIIENHFYDIGVAVGTDKGLMVPVVRDCDQLNFASIEKAIGDFGKRARDGKIQLPELQGGVFTISNGGIYGSMLSTPILNHPQAAIMGLHNIVERPVAENGQVVIRPIMYLALSYDHRLIDGKEAVTFLVKVRQYIEDPQRLLFGV
ncbi:MAG: 2-oxoglutarate dehydrogenase complex dihydrolipoyllysine-residue succinyltransferase [Opitutales bacterium]|jgi:2-oxoglutarate dehydrogenase E2 component (dihydrolipoamide succinyltransferase)|nr:2-oxoglutarate dehydrogenase complex dihydrolipoyllysine-residue succinyltransferase [Opitutales bacterium]MDP4659261.1 2-oxoglutarate dehydrogenase complex dihydrolipoyllysine-residue succinyltransferase [Opitutales bacterium]MDP4774850.1 2-oxoglutarate dehydrogenase complex dihydrolipoyllysine-residue succinyltransferase [Opitutales bacterium]MDP4787182.1 2-oxoglutarate dehydrogenase complex dihydrolipoyllysine-residue succinyltransferase [Opitutales bacterium]MDP4860737.1 2-oxoglutarate d